jgi:hypothetical protein
VRGCWGERKGNLTFGASRQRGFKNYTKLVGQPAAGVPLVMMVCLLEPLSLPLAVGWFVMAVLA